MNLNNFFSDLIHCVFFPCLYKNLFVVATARAWDRDSGVGFHKMVNEHLLIRRLGE